MTVYMVTGKLGGGKSLIATRRIQEYLEQGRRVVTNLDLFTHNLIGPDSEAPPIVRLPDKPSASDLASIGKGHDLKKHAEDRFGLVVLDELGSWLNSRTWNDKARLGVIDWCIHARKMRWDLIFLVQNISMIDAQVRDALCEYLVVCRRTDRLTIPLTNFHPPKIHSGRVYYGDREDKELFQERWLYKGTKLYNAYDTEQAFVPPDFYQHGCGYSLLPPRYWYREGVPEHWYRQPLDELLPCVFWVDKDYSIKVEEKKMGWKTVTTFTVIGLVILALVYGFANAKNKMFPSDSADDGDGTSKMSFETVVDAVAPEIMPVAVAKPMSRHPMLGYAYKGYMHKDGNYTEYYFEQVDGTLFSASADILQQLGYDILDTTQTSLITLWDGASTVFNAR